jgi:hypothetical protein
VACLVQLKVWQRAVPAAGGWLTTSASSQVTHILVGHDNPDAAAQQVLQGVAFAHPPHIVHYTWLENCLLKRQRLPEADFHPSAVAPPPPAGEPSALASEAAEGASAEHAAAGPAALNARSARVMIGDVQQLVQHLLGGARCPRGLVAHVSGRVGVGLGASVQGTWWKGGGWLQPMHVCLRFMGPALGPAGRATSSSAPG